MLKRIGRLQATWNAHCCVPHPQPRRMRMKTNLDHQQCIKLWGEQWHLLRAVQSRHFLLSFKAFSTLLGRMLHGSQVLTIVCNWEGASADHTPFRNLTSSKTFISTIIGLNFPQPRYQRGIKRRMNRRRSITVRTWCIFSICLKTNGAKLQTEAGRQHEMTWHTSFWIAFVSVGFCEFTDRLGQKVGYSISSIGGWPNFLLVYCCLPRRLT